MTIDHESYFPAGARVEVSMERKGYRDSWYVATIITPPGPPPPDFQNPYHLRGLFFANRLRYEKVTTVEYDNLKEEDGVTKLRETVDITQIRPIPPMETTKVEFKVRDLVDVSLFGGWWEGQIVDVPLEGMIFDVRFRRRAGRSFIFHPESFRIHREWDDGDDSWAPRLLDEDQKAKSESEPEVTEDTSSKRLKLS